MIVFLDIDKKTVTLYSESGSQTVDFDNIEVLETLSDGKVLYVTDAIDASAKEVVELVRSIAGQLPKTSVLSRIKNTGPTVIVASSNKSYIITDIDGLKFSGVKDYKTIAQLKADYGDNFLDRSPQLQKHLKNKLLKMISLSEAEAAVKKFNDDHNRQKKRIQSKKDEELDSLIIDQKVDKFLEGNEKGDGEETSADDPIEIDVTSGPSRGGSNNESGGLPEDF
jgi:hypothetical protein